MARKSLLKRAVSSFTALAIATVAMPVIPAFAETGAITYSFDGYDVEYSVKNEWTDGQSIEVKITNTGDEPILNWAFKYDAEGEINGLWNASVYDSQETNYVIKNVGWNYEIAPDASVSFGYTLSDYSGTNPDKFELCAKRVDKTEGYDVQYNIVNEWDTGLQGEIVITNTSDEPLEAWELSFDSTFAINNLWNGKIISSEDNHYVVASEMWSNPITVGESRTIGFTGIKNSESELSVDNYALSVVVIDTNGNNGGNDNPEPDIDLTTDTDGDMVPDAYEKVYGTDPENPDTDGDGLTDYEEIALTNSDPLVYNSIDESLSDEDADYDKDGLSTREELALGTDPTQADTDNDRINDYDEVNVWHTNPLVADTDNDGIVDGDEVKIGLDPANPETFGYPDIEFKSTQHISEDSISLSSINNEDNDIFIYSVDVTSNGYVEPYMYARESCYTSVMKNDFMIGVAPELVYLGNYDIDNIKVSFSISDEYIERTKSPEESKEDFLNRISIFRYFESANALLPVSTSIDEKTGALYTESNAVTTYCLMDRNAWLDMLYAYCEDEEEDEAVAETSLRLKAKSFKVSDDFNMSEAIMCSPPEGEIVDEGTQEDNKNKVVETINSMPLLYSVKAVSSLGAKPLSNKVIDVIFIIQSAGTSKSYFEDQKDTIAKISDALFSYSTNVRICILDYKYRSSRTTVEWYTEYSDVEDRLKDITYVSEKNYCNRSAAFGSIKENDFRANASKFILHFVNGANINLSSSDHTSFCYDNKINLSELKPEGWKYDYESAEKRISQAIKGTGGLYEVYYSSNWNKYYQHIINNSAEPEKEYRGLVPTCWKVITLEAPLIPHSDTDTDKDGISDWNEVQNDLLEWDSTGKIKQISLSEFILEYCNVGLNDLKQYKDNENEINLLLKDITILPLRSDPTDEDGDKDGILDIDEYRGNIHDERYKNIMPLKSDTVETLYPEMSLRYANGNNKESNCVYYSISGNNIVINARIKFDNSFNKEAEDLFYDDTNELDGNTIYDYNVTAKRVSGKNTYADIVMDGIKSRWEGEYIGSEYDFFKNMKISVKVNFYFYNLWDTLVGNSYILFLEPKYVNDLSLRERTFETDFYGQQDRALVSRSKRIFIFKEINDNVVYYESKAAHEFGHVLLLADMYPDEDRLYYIAGSTEVPNKVINSYLPSSAIMYGGGNAVLNDIEMALQGNVEDDNQHFTPQYDQSKPYHTLSKAIKSEQIYYKTIIGSISSLDRDSDARPRSYVWNEDERKFWIRLHLEDID